MLRRLSQTFVVVVLFASCWLTYFILLAANLPLLQKVFKMVSSDGGWLTILHHKLHHIDIITKRPADNQRGPAHPLFQFRI